MSDQGKVQGSDRAVNGTMMDGKMDGKMDEGDDVDAIGNIAVRFYKGARSNLRRL